MRKHSVVEGLIQALRQEFLLAVGAQRDAASYATSEESRAREQYDTQSTEAAYLARGQAALAESLGAAIEYFESNRAAFSETRQKAELGALVAVDFSGSIEWFFLSKCGGGHTVACEGAEVTIITPESPIGAAMLNQGQGASLSLPNGSRARLTEVR